MHKNNSPFDYILEFLQDPYNLENKKGLEVFLKIFLKEFNKYNILKNYADGEDLFYEFLENIIFKGKDFKLNIKIKEKLEDKKTNLISYVYMTIHNFLRTKYREIQRTYLYKEEGKVKQKFESFIKENEEGKEYEKVLINNYISPLIEIEAKEITQEIKKEFSEKEKQILCYMFFNDKKFFSEELSDDAIYKRKSRMKSKLSKFVKEKGFSLEGFSYFVQEYLMSEICKKFR